MNPHALNQAANKKLFYKLHIKDFGVTKVRDIYNDDIAAESFIFVNDDITSLSNEQLTKEA